MVFPDATRWAVLAAAAAIAVTAGCGKGAHERPMAGGSPTAPSASVADPRGLPSLGAWAAGRLASDGASLSARDVSFPPRDQAYDFRANSLETKYRDGLRRSPVSSFVDIEGTIVWTQEYLRYRVNLCDHETAIQKVFAQIIGGGVSPTCGNVSGNPSFPPRDQPFDFRQRLEAVYRDQLRRSAVQTFVDVEGDIVWTQEYLRYRVGGCDHFQAVDRVLSQIDGRGIAAVCVTTTVSTTTVPATTTVPGTSTFSYAVSPTERSVAASGGTFSTSVSTNRSDAQWRATTDQSWLSVVSGTTGTGAGTVTYSVGSNGSTSSRVGHVTVSGLSGQFVPAIHTVTQSGASATPVAVISGDTSCFVSTPCQFSGLGSANAATYEWNFGFGISSTSATPVVTYPSNTIQTTFTSIPVTITLVVRNTAGQASATASFTLTLRRNY